MTFQKKIVNLKVIITLEQIRHETLKVDIENLGEKAINAPLLERVKGIEISSHEPD